MMFGVPGILYSVMKRPLTIGVDRRIISRRIFFQLVRQRFRRLISGLMRQKILAVGKTGDFYCFDFQSVAILLRYAERKFHGGACHEHLPGIVSLVIFLA